MEDYFMSDKKYFVLMANGTNRVHNFEGWIEVVDKPANGPDWLPPKINKANVKKIGITRL